MDNDEKKELKKHMEEEIKEGIRKMLAEAEFVRKNNQKESSDSK